MNGEEREILAVELRPDRFAPWRGSFISITNLRIHGRVRRSFLDLIPTGWREFTEPLDQVTSATVARRVEPVAVAAGLMGVLLIGLGVFGFEEVRIFRIVLGALCMLVALFEGVSVRLEIVFADGSGQGLRVCRADRAKAESVVAALSTESLET